jgi:glutathione S-transferase
MADTQLDPPVIVVAVLKLFRPEVGEQHPGALAAAADVLGRHWAHLDEQLGARDWLAGPFSRADIAVAAHVAAAGFMGYGPTRATPRFAAWAKRAAERPCIARATQDALAAYQESQTNPEAFFNTKRLHWRDARIEWLVRCGLGPWLLAEIAGGKAFFSTGP